MDFLRLYPEEYYYTDGILSPRTLGIDASCPVEKMMAIMSISLAKTFLEDGRKLFTVEEYQGALINFEYGLYFLDPIKIEEQVELSIKLHFQIGRSYYEMSVYDKAAIHLKEAHDLHKASSGQIEVPKIEKIIEILGKCLEHTKISSNPGSLFFDPQSKLDKLEEAMRNILSAIDIWDWRCSDDENLKNAKKASIEEFQKNELFSKLSSQSLGYGFEINEITGDGNCFFQSILKQLQERHPEILLEIASIANISSDKISNNILRKLAVGALMVLRNRFDNPAEFENDMNAYITSQGGDGTWAEGEIIRATANVLGITLVLVNSNGTEPTVITEGHAGTLFLAYHVGVHFDSLTGEPSPVMQQLVADRQASSAVSNSIFLEDAWNLCRNHTQVWCSYGFKK